MVIGAFSSSADEMRSALVWKTVQFYSRVIPELFFNAIILFELKENIEEMRGIMTQPDAPVEYVGR